MEEMKCLFCQRSSSFDFKHIRWPDNTPERAFYLCPYCGKNIYTIPQATLAEYVRAFLEHKGNAGELAQKNPCIFRADDAGARD